MDKMCNLGISFPGNVALGGKTLQFLGKTYHSEGYFCIFLTHMSIYQIERNNLAWVLLGLRGHWFHNHPLGFFNNLKFQSAIPLTI